MTLYTTLVYGILYLTIFAYPYTYLYTRHLPPGPASLPFLSLLTGILLAALLMGLGTYLRFHRTGPAAAVLPPEARLPPMMAGSLLLAAGLFTFAWTSSPLISLWPSIIAGGLIGSGFLLVFGCGIVYLVDVYPDLANSALAANTFVRSLCAAAFPLFCKPLYERLGVGWATSVFGVLCVVMVPAPVLFWAYGERMRGWSRFAVEKRGEEVVGV